LSTKWKNCVANQIHLIDIICHYFAMSLTSFPTPNWLEPILTKVWSMKQIWCLNLNFDLGDDDDLEVSPTTNQQTRPRTPE